MGVQLAYDAFDKAIGDVQAAAGRLADDRATADARVRGFLGRGWTGVAAESFVEAWDDWRSAAEEVHEALVAMGELMAATRDDLVQQDTASQERSDTLAARIIDRLG